MVVFHKPFDGWKLLTLDPRDDTLDIYVFLQVRRLKHFSWSWAFKFQYGSISRKNCSFQGGLLRRACRNVTGCTLFMSSDLGENLCVHIAFANVIMDQRAISRVRQCSQDREAWSPWYAALHAHKQTSTVDNSTSILISKKWEKKVEDADALWIGDNLPCSCGCVAGYESTCPQEACESWWRRKDEERRMNHSVRLRIPLGA